MFPNEWDPEAASHPPFSKATPELGDPTGASTQGPRNQNYSEMPTLETLRRKPPKQNTHAQHLSEMAQGLRQRGSQEEAAKEKAAIPGR